MNNFVAYKQILAFALGTGLIGQNAQAASYQLDVPHTQVLFSINHLGFSNSNGMLRIKEGGFDFVEGDWSKAKLDVTIDVGSLDFGDKTWNEHMAADKFFNTAKFPTMRFVSTKVTGSGDTGTAEGTLTLLGVGKPVMLSITRNKIGKHPMSNKDYAGFSATATLKRSDFGMTTYAEAIGDEVKIRIEAEAALKP